MLNDASAQDRFQFDDNLAINPGWKIQSSYGVSQAICLYKAVDNGLIMYLHLTNGNQHRDTKPHTFCVQAKLGDRKVSMMVLSTPSPAWYPAVCVVCQVQAKTCTINDALKGTW